MPEIKDGTKLEVLVKQLIHERKNDIPPINHEVAQKQAEDLLVEAVLYSLHAPCSEGEVRNLVNKGMPVGAVVQEMRQRLGLEPAHHPDGTPDPADDSPSA